jgi:hypothetical protein
MDLKPWVCAACTSSNQLSRRLCSVCRAERRPRTLECAQCTFRNDFGATVCEVCGWVCVVPPPSELASLVDEEDVRERAELEKQVRARNQWSCGACTYRNPGTVANCDVCGAKKEDAAAMIARSALECRRSPRPFSACWVTAPLVCSAMCRHS